MDPKLLTRLRRPVAAFVLLASAAVLIGVARSQPARPRPLDPGFHAAGQGLTPSERAGREIWFKATAGNDRFHTYVFQQRLGVLIDWYRVLRSTGRGERFKTWGIINDPDCCTPGIAELPEEEPRRDLRLRLLPGRRRPAGARRQAGLSRSRVRLSRMRPLDPKRPARREGSAAERVRSGVRHVDRRARLPEVSRIRGSTPSAGDR